MNTPRVSIVIPVYNNLFFTRQCLQALKLVTPVSHEIIVVDNASMDGTREYLEEQAVRVIANSENRGFAKACNQGAKEARGEYLVFLNNDTIPQPRWLESMLELCRDGVGLVGSRLLFPDGTIQHAGLAFAADHHPHYLFFRFPATFLDAMENRELQAVSGACIMLERQIFERVGGFDEGYLNSWEDVDLCMKVRSEGLKVMACGQSTLFHYESMSDGRFGNDQSNEARFMSRWGGMIREDLSSFTTVPSADLAGAILASRWETKTSSADAVEAYYRSLLNGIPLGEQIIDHFDREQRLLRKQMEAMRGQLSKFERILPLGFLRFLKHSLRAWRRRG